MNQQENSENEENQLQSQKLSDRIDTNVKIVIAFFLGAILAGTLVQFALPVLAEHVSELLIGFIAVIGILAIIALIFTIFKEFFFKLFFGISKADLKDVKISSQSMVENAVKLDWLAASNDFKVISEKGSAWYAWLSYRRWVVTVFYTLFLAFAGLLGSVLLYNQNQLLEKQNEKIDAQIQLEESNRRGALIVMMSNIMDKVDDELTTDWNNDKKRNLSPQLIGRISALSQSFSPYRFWQDTSLIEKPLSPERGQLLLALVKSDLDTNTYKTIYNETTFESAYLDGAKLNSAFLKSADLNNASLRDVFLVGANMNDIKLMNADISNSIILKSFLNNARLEDINFSGTNLWLTELNRAIMTGDINLFETDLRDVELNYASVSWNNMEERLNEWNVKGKENIIKTYKMTLLSKKGSPTVYRFEKTKEGDARNGGR